MELLSLILAMLLTGAVAVGSLLGGPYPLTLRSAADVTFCLVAASPHDRMVNLNISAAAAPMTEPLWYGACDSHFVTVTELLIWRIP